MPVYHLHWFRMWWSRNVYKASKHKNSKCPTPRKSQRYHSTGLLRNRLSGCHAKFPQRQASHPERRMRRRLSQNQLSFQSGVWLHFRWNVKCGLKRKKKIKNRVATNETQLQWWPSWIRHDHVDSLDSPPSFAFIVLSRKELYQWITKPVRIKS